jgi:hypothetical protein
MLHNTESVLNNSGCLTIHVQVNMYYLSALYNQNETSFCCQKLHVVNMLLCKVQVDISVLAQF